MKCLRNLFKWLLNFSYHSDIPGSRNEPNPEVVTTSDPIDKDCKITNNSGSDVIVISGFNSDSDSTNLLYDQDTLTTLDLKAGGQIIKSGSTGTVTLDRSTGTGADKKYNMLYNLIFANPASLFPILTKGEMMDFMKNNYPPISISSTDKDNYQLSETFHKTLLAFPTSNMASDWQSAVTNTFKNSNSESDINNGIDAFFKKYKQFSALTLDKVIAVSTYYNEYAAPWATYAASYTYYLYSSDGTTVTPQGTLTLKAKNVTPPLATSDHSGGYTLTYTDPSNNTTPMFYSQGQFVSSTTQAVPGICLQGLFVLKSTLTKVSTDNTLIPVISGNVNGQKVMGTNMEKTIHGGAWVFFHPKNFQGWVSLLMTVFGALMILDWLAGKLGVGSLLEKIKAKIAEKRGIEPEKTEIEKMRDDIDSLKTEMQKNQQDLLDKFDDNLKAVDPDELSAQLDKFKADYQERLLEDQADAMEGIIEEQSKILEQLAEVEATPELEAAAQKLKDTQDALDNATTTEELKTAIDNAKTNLEDVGKTLDTAYDNVESELSEEVKGEISDAKSNIDDYTKESDEIDDTLDDLDTGEIPDIDA